MSDDWNATDAFRLRRSSSIVRGLYRRILASASLVVGALVFTLLYLAFLAARFSWYQNLAVVVSVALVVPTALVLMWIAWAFGFARRHAFYDD